MKLFAFTAAVTQGVTLTCSPTGFNVVLTEDDVFENPLELTDAQRLTEVFVQTAAGDNSPTCSGALSNEDSDDTTLNQISLTEVDDSCTWAGLGVLPTYDADTNQFTYTVNAGVMENPTVSVGDVAVMLTRRQNVELSCTYNAKVDIKYDNVVVDASELAADVTTTDDGDSLGGYFTLSAFSDVDRTAVLDADNKITLGDTVFNQLTQTNLPVEFGWFVDSCTASSDADGTISVPLFEDFECANDIFNTQLEHTVATAQAGPYGFNFQSFAFGSTAGDSQVYLTCSVQVCLAGEVCGTRVTDCTDLGTSYTFNTNAPTA